MANYTEWGFIVIKHFLIWRTPALERRTGPTQRYDEFMRDVTTAVDTAGWKPDGRQRAGADRVETFVDEWAAQPAIMNSLRDRISSAGQLAERSAY